MKTPIKLLPFLAVLFLVLTPISKADIITDLTPAWRVTADHLATVAGGSLTNGQTVTQWKDQVGTVHMGTIGGRANPTYATGLNAFAGHSAVQFQPAGVGALAQALGNAAPGAVYSGTAQTMVVVFSRTANSGSVLGFEGSNDWSNRRTIGMTTYLFGEKGAGDKLLAGDSQGSGSNWAQSATALPTYTAGDYNSQVWGILTVDSGDSPTDRLYQNDATYTGFTQVASFSYQGPPTPAHLWVGQAYHGSAVGFSGYLAEAIIWNRTLDSDEVQLVADYLRDTYIPILGDYVWRDLNMNGIQDLGEPGFPGVTVNLLDNLGNTLDSTVTDANGKYQFLDLAAGQYELEFIKPGGYLFSPQNVGDNLLDSDPDLATGRTGVFSLSLGQDDRSWDAGIFIPEPASLVLLGLGLTMIVIRRR